MITFEGAMRGDSKYASVGEVYLEQANPIDEDHVQGLMPLERMLRILPLEALQQIAAGTYMPTSENSHIAQDTHDLPTDLPDDPPEIDKDEALKAKIAAKVAATKKP